jgi:hypothetical protein
MKDLLFKHTVLFALLLSSPLLADTVYVAQSNRVALGTIVSDASPEMRSIDLGPAAPPGSSRLFSRDAIRLAIREAGYDPSTLSLPRNVRVKSPAKRLSPAQVAELARPAVERALPAGVVLKQIKAPTSITVSPRVIAGDVEISVLPKRSGRIKLAATLQLLEDGIVTERVPLTLALEVSKEALVPAVKRGAAISLVIARGAATVSADGAALEDASVGDLSRFRVVKTGRVVRARLISPRVATVTEGS